MRLICMGRGLLQDHQTLDGCKIPAFPTHPTPVNVSVFRRAPPVTRGAFLSSAQIHIRILLSYLTELWAAIVLFNFPEFPQATKTKSVASSGCGCVLQ